MSCSEQSEMQRSLRPSTPEDGPKIITLMREAGLHPPVDPNDFFWKYWQEREDWSGPRSYVLTDGTELLAHLGLVPAICRSESRTLRIGSVVDWAALPRAVGAGARLMKYVGTLTDGLLSIQASPVAGKVMRLMGYQPHGSITGYVRTLNPLSLLRQTEGPAWRLPPRVARSIIWTLTAPRPAGDEWGVRQIGTDQVDRIASVLPRNRDGLTVLERIPSQLRYLLACPTVPMRLYALQRQGRIRGFFILAFIPGQARLVDCWTDSLDPSAWRALIQCAVMQAKAADNVAELVTWGNDALLEQCLTECGFHPRFTAPVYLRTKGALPIAAGVLRVQMSDSDVAYPHGDGRSLWA